VRFLYLRDPLFVSCVVLYFANRWIFKALWRAGFVHDHLNDLICIPFWVPIMLWGQRRLGLRASDGAPLANEIILPLFVWSWVFEYLLPRSRLVGDRAVADYLDILYYSLGASLAAAFWAWRYRARSDSQASTSRTTLPATSVRR
jgi:hypothetical protein